MSPKKVTKRKAIKKKKPLKKKPTLKRKPALKKKPASRKKAAPKKKLTLKKKPALKKSKENVIGIITHYFPHVRAAVIKLKAPLSVGDTVKIKGHTTDFIQNVISMQIDRTPLTKAKKGDEIGLLVDSRVRQHDTVSKV
ncbi:MAG: hypothetical protein M0R66_08735 [Candidatus Omnitrophica bacterium]|nr:hypothetical protein [Candidatus Omnitrophota bacterium]